MPLDYRVYGFAVRSAFELPELRPLRTHEAESLPGPLVEIRASHVPPQLRDETRLDATFSFSGTACLLSIPELCRILVEAGRTITLDMVTGGREDDMRTYLLGSALGTIAHQRGLIPLHVSAVVTPLGALAFTGPSGAGKSTAVAELHARRNWPIVSDDVAILTATAHTVVLEGGVNRLRLWSDALARLDWSTEGLARDTHRADKFLSLAHGSFWRGAAPLRALYVIDPEMTGGATRLTKAFLRFEALANAVYRPFLVPIIQDRRRVHAGLAHAAQHLEVFVGPRPALQEIDEILRGLTASGEREAERDLPGPDSGSPGERNAL